MGDQDRKDRAEERFQQAMEARGARDPRVFYRKQLRELRARDEQAYRRAVDYYENRLIPAVASEESDPLAEWLEYGRLLAQYTADGSTVQIDPSGRSHPYAPPVPPDHLVLHLPTSTREPAMAVGIPSQLSPAQRATYALLVRQAVA